MNFLRGFGKKVVEVQKKTLKKEKKKKKKSFVKQYSWRSAASP